MRTRRRVLLSFNATTNAATEMDVCGGQEKEPLPVRRIPASGKRRRGNDAAASPAAKERFFSRKRSKRSPLPPASSFSTRRSDVGCGGEGDQGRDEGGCGGHNNYFEALPDDLIVCILFKLSASASRPADFVNVLVTCKRLNGLALNSMVLAKASPKCFALKAKNWSDSSHRFLKLCADAGNIEACYTLGMIRFYCQENRGSGASLMAKAAIGSHAQALYSLAVIQFNGSGGSKSDKDLRAGVALCARAAFLGHVDALRELGHCLQDGYGVRQNVADGRRFLVQANARELASAATDPSALSAAARSWIAFNPLTRFPRLPAVAGAGVAGCPLLSDFGCNVPAPEPHPANKFLAEWFADRRSSGPEGELRMCSHAGCGRPETRQHEFRRCSVCGRVNYCSRACQAWDWKLRHKAECSPAAARWGAEGGGGVVEGEVFGAAAVVGGDS